MDILFQNVLTASVHGSIVIAAVLVLRLCLRKAPKKFTCWLWLLVGIRLLMPFEIQSSLSLQPESIPVVEEQWVYVPRYDPGPVMAPQTNLEDTPQEPVDVAAPEKEDTQVLPAPVPEAIPQAAEPMPVSSKTNGERILPWFWLTIASCFGIYSVYTYLSLKSKVREAIKIPGGWECDRIDTAFILGFVRPRIYIPMGMSLGVRRHFLALERTHLEKVDDWFIMLGFFALAVHWFNPLVWIAYILLCKDIEMACDERVVQFMDLEERKSYSAALLSCSTNRAHFAACPVAFGEVSVKNRIQSVLRYRRPGFWISLLGLAAVAFVAVCLVTSPADNAGDTPGAGETTSAAVDPILQMCYDDLRAVFDRDSYSVALWGNNAKGHMAWEVILHKQGEDTLWTYRSDSDMDVSRGRLVYDGETYALQNGSWLKTEATDEEFAVWENILFWDLETARYSDEEIREGVHIYRFTTQWEKENSVNTGTMEYYYDADGKLSSIRARNIGAPEDAEVIFSVENITWEEKTTEDYFADAAAAIGEGQISVEALDAQEEYASWGLYFRVDDDRLSTMGSDVYYGQDENGLGVLTTTDKYWLEVWKNDAWEVVPTIREPDWSDGQLGTPKGSSTYGYLDWSGYYGKLSAGRYRMGKTFECYDYDTDYHGKHDFYAEFAISPTGFENNADAEAAMERCYAGIQELLSRKTIHFKKTIWVRMRADGYSEDMTEEYWINGDNFLSHRKYSDNYFAETARGREDIQVRWDGVGYTELREDPGEITSPVIGMQVSTLSPNTVPWEVSFEDDGDLMFFERSNKQISFPEGVGVISDREVTCAVTWRNEGSPEYYVEKTYLFDEAGHLTTMIYRSYDEGEVTYTDTVEIFDTTAEEIDAKIKPYTEDLILEDFSWEEARKKYTDEDFNIRESGFVNNGGREVTHPLDAIRLALAEYPNLKSYLDLTTFRDEAAGMWKVTIRSYYEYQASYEYRDIYLTDTGETKLLVYEGPICSYDDSERK